MDPKYRVIVENWNKFINEEEQVEEGLFDSFKGLFGKGKKEPEEEKEPYDQDKSFDALNDAVAADKFFSNAFSLAAYLYFMTYEDSPSHYSRERTAREFFGQPEARDEAMNLIPVLGDNIYEIEKFLKFRLGDKQRKILIDFSKKNNLEQALDMPGFEDFLQSMRESNMIRRIAKFLRYNFSDEDAKNRSRSGREEMPLGAKIDDALPYVG